MLASSSSISKAERVASDSDAAAAAGLIMSFSQRSLDDIVAATPVAQSQRFGVDGVEGRGRGTRYGPQEIFLQDGNENDPAFSE